MRASILKTICVLALAAFGLGLTGCSCSSGNNCRDAWHPYASTKCDLVEGAEACACGAGDQGNPCGN